MALRTRTPWARALLPAIRSRASGQLGALLSSPVLGVRLMTALQVLQVLGTGLARTGTNTGTRPHAEKSLVTHRGGSEPEQATI